MKIILTVFVAAAVEILIDDENYIRLLDVIMAITVLLMILETYSPMISEVIANFIKEGI
ncbi:MAG: hypothetical protein IKC38_03405 [Clostridia bacterium]|nr:hypothetical protein [Clostridia bacterium]